MKATKRLTIEGYSPEEILQVPDEILNQWIFINEPIVFQAGSAEILGIFRITADTFVIELAQIDGGGEGVLPTLWVLVEKYAQQRSLKQVEWLVHAINCAKPNLKLRRVLKRRGFEIVTIPETGEVYRYTYPLESHLDQK